MTTPSNSLRVIDTAAKTGPRTHEMPNEPGERTSTYTFPDWQTAIEVPVHHAMIFAQIPDFECYGIDGKPIKLRKVDGAAGSGKLVLRADETIARLDELTRDAIIERVKRLPGGDKLARLKVKDMIDALLAANKPDLRTDGDEDEESLIDDSDEDEDGEAKPIKDKLEVF